MLWFVLLWLCWLEVLVNDIDNLTVRSYDFIIPLFPFFLWSVVNVESVLLFPRGILHSCIVLSLYQGVQTMF